MLQIKKENKKKEKVTLLSANGKQLNDKIWNKTK